MTPTHRIALIVAATLLGLIAGYATGHHEPGQSFHATVSVVDEQVQVEQDAFVESFLFGTTETASTGR